jgi:cytochrome c oxidase assembly protein subunit 11
MATEKSAELSARGHRRVAFSCIALVIAMVAAAYASVPLYRLFCEATGFAGTPQRVAQASGQSLDKTLSIRFDANVTPGMPWRFEPVERTLNVKIGENALAFYRATNLSDHAVTGMATFNVTPEPAGAFFNKLQCFCFSEQVLAPGQTVEMPVSFFVDPQIVNDRDGRSISLIVLSYTFYPVEPKAGLAGGAPASAPPRPAPASGSAG